MPAAFAHRLRHALLGRVYHAAKPHEDQIFFENFFFVFAAGKPQYAQRALCHILHRVGNGVPVGKRQRTHARRGQYPRAFFQDDVRPALYVA